MTTPPRYFEAIQRRAAARWDQLEQDPELAGPWHQLFKQVQSPRHVLSELLQNADDAGARSAAVRIEGGTFVFEHDGEDFREEHFASLCRFGYSNKRALHTIGFRGIGFKSTFSLGDCVEVSSPSLALKFLRKRFTQPIWTGEGIRQDGMTCVRVAISDDHRKLELQRNLDEWAASPVSLMFFKSIRRLRIGDLEVHWTSGGPGPSPGSQIMELKKPVEQSVILVRSGAEEFPPEALAEIRQERMLTGEEEGSFPPCTVEIVLGLPGRLYVVLPTGVETSLPFACNGPFIQDPARLKIKDPETSPTNRWLLARAGNLAANAMLSMLDRKELSEQTRAFAYHWQPDVDRKDNSLPGVCGTIAELEFSSVIKGAPYLLCDGGALVPAKQAVVLPEAITRVWPALQAAALLDAQGRAPLSLAVSSENRRKLMKWGAVDEIDKAKVVQSLLAKHLPRPATWDGVVSLWAFIAPDVTAYYSPIDTLALNVVPAEGDEVLHSAREVVRLGEKKLLESDADWQLLATHLTVLNQAWARHLGELKKANKDRGAPGAGGDAQAALAVLARFGLEEAAGVTRVLERVTASFFKGQGLTLASCVQLAQIAAKLGASVGDKFRYVTRTRHFRDKQEGVIFEGRGSLATLLPEDLHKARVLHEQYTAAFTSCTRDEWSDWVSSGRSGLLEFPALQRKDVTSIGRQKFEKELRSRGMRGPADFTYKSETCLLQDWDFEAGLWDHWSRLAAEDDSVWAQVVDRVLAMPDGQWTAALNATAVHVASSGTTRAVTRERLAPAWILRLRNLNCLRDTHGFRHKPADLLRRAPESEALMDVEPFVHASLDREATRPLLDLLGVRTRALGPGPLLERLRALAGVEKPPLGEVERWYRRLDQMVDACSTADIQMIKEAFRVERLIFTDKGEWVPSSGVFLSSDEAGVPDAACIRASVVDLALWRKIGVAERPTPELALAWLRSLPTGQKVPAADLSRVRSLLIRHPARVWEECGHWLNLAGEWTPASDLSFAITMQTLVPWKHLHEWVKQKTADLQGLPYDVTNCAPFDRLRSLAASVSDQFHRDPAAESRPEVRPWLNALGRELRRVVLEQESETERIRLLAAEVEATQWLRVPSLEIIPYIDGTPAGTPRRTDVLWLDRVLYVSDVPLAKLARRVPEEVARSFEWPSIKAAFDYCFERSPSDVRAYLEENYELAAGEATQPPVEAPLENIVGRDGPGLVDEVGALEEASGVPDAEPSVDGVLGGELSSEVLESPPVSADEVPPSLDLDAPVEEEQPKQPAAARKPPKASIIERYAAANGFQKDGDSRYFHGDGSWIGKTQGERFPWEHRSASGELVRYYLPKDHCLEAEPLEVEADVWGLMDGMPEVYALVLSNERGEPSAVPGARLQELKAQGKLRIHPASYRLVLEN